MTITKTYSSWTRNRLTPELRDRIRDAGPGEVEFMAAIGKPVGWVGCRITADDGSAWAVGPDPARAFDNAVIELAVDIVSVLA